MKSRMLGSIEVSEIGIGCMGFSHGYGPIPPIDESIEAIQVALAAGCTFFDTAEAYGPNLLPENLGHNERIVGLALADKRDRVVVATKLHLPTDEVRRDGVLAAVRRHLEGSLERLCTDRADLYYLHRINPEIPAEDVAEAMGNLAAEGLIRGWGLSQVGVEHISRAHGVFPMSAVQNIYSMVERGIEAEVQPYCLANGIGLVAFSPIASGLLSGKVTDHTQFAEMDDVRRFVPQLSPENLAANRPLVDLLEDVATANNTTPAQVSLAWMLHRYPNLVPIPGSKNRDRIAENLGAAEVQLTEDEYARLQEELDAIEIHGDRGFNESEGRRFLPRP